MLSADSGLRLGLPLVIEGLKVVPPTKSAWFATVVSAPKDCCNDGTRNELPADARNVSESVGLKITEILGSTESSPISSNSSYRPATLTSIRSPRGMASSANAAVVVSVPFQSSAPNTKSRLSDVKEESSTTCPVSIRRCTPTARPIGPEAVSNKSPAATMSNTR